ncbi:hypothetical protein, partial [Staphylococcus epidermidis]|uniref:hypothetical protein n=1 Tax=Staphylococcus epidermidis TaxID=1282 RepID=UPI0021B41A26
MNTHNQISPFSNTQNIFKKSIHNTKPHQTFLFYHPPPTPNPLPHPPHLLPTLIKHLLPTLKT